MKEESHCVTIGLLYWLIVLCMPGCDNSPGPPSTSRGRDDVEHTLAPQRRPEDLKITYQYTGTIGPEGLPSSLIGIPSGAIAFDGDKRIAEAKFIKIIETESGAKNMEIEETYFSDSGDITYRGTIIMQFAIDGASVVEVRPISGIRSLPIFESWPSGN